MNPDDLKKILDALSSADVREFSLKTGSFDLDLKRGPQVQATQSAAAAPAPMPVAPVSQPAPESMVAAPTPAAEVAAASAPAQAEATPAQAEAEAAAAPKPASGIPVKAPIVGTFYAAPSPDADPYVKVGDSVQEGQVLCIIEAMKLMNEIEAEQAGVIREISVQNGEPVEFGQTLFIIE